MKILTSPNFSELSPVASKSTVSPELPPVSAATNPAAAAMKKLARAQRRKSALDYATHLSKLAAIAPDELAARDLNRLVHRIRRRYLSTPEKRQRIVLRAIQSGCATIAEIADSSGFSEKSARKILQILLSAKKIRATTMGGRRNGGRGNSKLYYFPI